MVMILIATSMRMMMVSYDDDDDDDDILAVECWVTPPFRWTKGENVFGDLRLPTF